MKSASLLSRMARNRTAYLFLLPAIALLTGIKYYPFVKAAVDSLYSWNGANVKNFIGLDNYVNLFKDHEFLVSFKNILILSAATILINLVFPLLAALLVFHIRRPKAQSIFKVGFIVPMVVPMMVTILMWRWIYSGDFGVLNQFLDAVGLSQLEHPWLGSPSTALGAIIFIGFPWIAGVPFLLYLAGFIGIPKELFEVARIDGVNAWHRLLRIELPLVASQIKLVFIYVLIHAFQTFEQPYVLTNGGPGDSTTTPALLLYNQAFNYSKFGYASSVGFVLFAVVLLITFASQKLMKNTERID